MLSLYQRPLEEKLTELWLVHSIQGDRWPTSLVFKTCVAVFLLLCWVCDHSVSVLTKGNTFLYWTFFLIFLLYYNPNFFLVSIGSATNFSTTTYLTVHFISLLFFLLKLSPVYLCSLSWFPYLPFLKTTISYLV